MYQSVGLSTKFKLISRNGVCTSVCTSGTTSISLPRRLLLGILLLVIGDFTKKIHGRQYNMRHECDIDPKIYISVTTFATATQSLCECVTGLLFTKFPFRTAVTEYEEHSNQLCLVLFTRFVMWYFCVINYVSPYIWQQVSRQLSNFTPCIGCKRNELST